MTPAFVPFLSGFTPYIQIFATLCSAYALWDSFRSEFDKVITTKENIVLTNEIFLKLSIINQELENELKNSEYKDATGLLKEISEKSVQKAKDALNETTDKHIPEVLKAYEEIEDFIKNRIAITKPSFLLTAIYCFVLLILSGIETHYQWSIFRIERMIFWYSILTLFGIIMSIYYWSPNKTLILVNSKSIIIFTLLYSIIMLISLWSCKHFDFIIIENKQLNASIQVGTILLIPLLPFILHIWIMPFLIKQKKKVIHQQYLNIISQLPEPIKKRIDISEPPI